MRGGDVFLRSRHLVFVEEQYGRINGSMRVVQPLGGQSIGGREVGPQQGTKRIGQHLRQRRIVGLPRRHERTDRDIAVEEAEDSGGNVWGFGVFEDEKLYRANAADPEQGKIYEGFRALLEADPEWHDGSIAQRPA